MKLFYDARYIRPIDDGVSRYSTQLGAALAKLTDVTFIICDEQQLQKLPTGAAFVKIHAPTSAKEIFLPRILNRFQPDIVFSPLHGPGIFGRKYKSILTSHDMIYYHHRTPPKNIGNGLIRLLWRLYFATYIPQRIVLNSADLVVTVSESAKKEFEAAKLTKRPILVIPNAPNDLVTLLPALPDVSEKAPRNIIYMGAFLGYKNVETLIKAMALLPDYTLHLLSRVTPKRQAELANLAGETRVIFHNGVSDQQYADLLANNALLATASLDEGYGLPVAEALALGIPAVISDIPVFHEVAGDGALYFDPHNPEDFVAKVTQLDNQALRAQVSVAGKAHIATFNWDTSAQILYDAILSLEKD
jgi:glycosyltransferase involved in cell wall biosynthesis